MRRDRGSWGHQVGERRGGAQREDFWESEEMEECMEGWGWSGGRSRGGLYSPRGRKKPEAGAGVDRCPSRGSEGGRPLQWGEWVQSGGDGGVMSLNSAVGLLGPALVFPPLPFPEQPSKLWVSGHPQARRQGSPGSGLAVCLCRPQRAAASRRCSAFSRSWNGRGAASARRVGVALGVAERPGLSCCPAPHLSFL